MKTWTYEEITQKAEKRIKNLMESSKTSPNEFERKLFQRWAFGTFSFWDVLTKGWQNDGDCERLEALTQREGE